ncbi:MAG TPA: hypothetical protein VFY83_10565 [Anaerolineales bacterium]|nr:hypothetical protein [Anaerolineales bacterium]
MANKKSRNIKLSKPGENQEKKRTRLLRIFIIVFSILLILSMVLSLTQY